MFREELISKLEEVALGMRKARTRVFSKSGLGSGQARVLSTLFEYGELSQADIGRIVDIAGPTVKKLVSNLSAKGLIKISESGKDRRMNVVALTKAGKAQKELIDAAIKEIESIVIAGLSEPEIIMTGMLLSRIDENLKNSGDFQ